MNTAQQATDLQALVEDSRSVSEVLIVMTKAKFETLVQPVEPDRFIVRFVHGLEHGLRSNVTYEQVLTWREAEHTKGGAEVALLFLVKETALKMLEHMRRTLT